MNQKGEAGESEGEGGKRNQRTAGTHRQSHPTWRRLEDGGSDDGWDRRSEEARSR